MLKKFLTLILIVTIGSALLAQTPKPETTQYTCVMHPEVVQDHPGKCPKCGMELVPVRKQRKRRTPNVEHRMSNAEEHAMHDHQAGEGHAMHHHAEHDHMRHEMKMQSSVNLTD